MADRTSAEIFGWLFAELAKTPDERSKSLAVDAWKQTQQYDFTEDQMCCDDNLVALGLARKSTDYGYEYADRKGVLK